MKFKVLAVLLAALVTPIVAEDKAVKPSKAEKAVEPKAQAELVAKIRKSAGEDMWSMFQATPIKTLAEGIYLSSGKGFALEVKADKNIFVHDASGSRKVVATEDAFGLKLEVMKDVHIQLRKNSKGETLFGVYDVEAEADRFTLKAGQALKTAENAHKLQKFKWKDAKNPNNNYSMVFGNGGNGHIAIDSGNVELLWRPVDKECALFMFEVEAFEIHVRLQGDKKILSNGFFFRHFGKLNKVNQIPEKFQMDVIRFAQAKEQLENVGSDILDFFSDEDETVMPAALHSFDLDLEDFTHPLTRKIPKNFDEVMEEKSGYFLLYEPMQFWEPLNNETSALICTRPGALGKDDSRSLVLYGDGHVATVKLPAEIKTREQLKIFFGKAAQKN